MRESRSFLKAVPYATAAVVLVMTAVVLAGWLTGSVSLQTLSIGQVRMKPNTAIGLGLGALAQLLLSRSDLLTAKVLARALAAIVVTIGVLTLLEYVFGANLGIDELLISAQGEAALTNTPGRMAAVTAFEFVLFGAGLFLLDERTATGFRIADPLLSGTAAIALMAFLGYVYGAIPTAGVGHGIQIAIPTAVALFSLACGTLALRPHTGWISGLLSDDAGGILARRLLPFVFCVPLILGGLRMGGAWLTSYSVPTMNAIVAVLTMVAFGSLTTWTSKALKVADLRREEADRERVRLATQEAASRALADAEQGARAAAENARITAEKLAREKTEALALLDLLMNSSPVGFALHDRDFRFLRINPALAAINGVATEAHLGLRPRDILPAMGEQIEPHFEAVLSTGQPVLNREVSLETPGEAGRDRHWLVSVYPVRGRSDDILGLGLIVVERTEQKQLELQFLQAQKMEAVGRLAGGIAHDFNNLLTVITSYSDLALSDLEPSSTLHEDLTEIRNSAERATALTAQLLSFSRKRVVQPAVLDINECVRGLRKMLGRVIDADIELRTSLADDLWLVMADQGQMEQVLMNLALNACDAMVKGGTLTIETANVDLGGEFARTHANPPPGRYVMLAVSDTGHGMGQDVQRRIFEPFFTTKERGKGTGLGLSTVYGIVTQCGGHVAVYSEPGRGTSFKIYLPLTDDAVAESSVSAPSLVARGTETILIVEDEEAVRHVARRILSEAGYRVLEATDGNDALALLRNDVSKIDLLVTDVAMPGMGGPELAARLKMLRPGLPVLFMSGFTEDALARQSFVEPGAVFLEKPFTPSVLARKVRQALEAQPGPGKLKLA